MKGTAFNVDNVAPDLHDSVISTFSVEVLTPLRDSNS
jgi:hypothetical protein